ncbi:MAG: hypothetical protein OEM84_08290 [Acidimicrobiia bacterium]|nr:hypothetical protein [Acidimicrobiia bacterium]
MTSYLDGLTERDLGTLAAIVGAESDGLAAELRRRPWWIHDLLARPDVFEKVLDRHAHPADVVSPFLLFSVLMHKTTEDLREATYVSEWVGPQSRMPLFDVAPLQEFIEDPGRTSFLTALLASFAVPEFPPVPSGPFDLYGLALWLDQAIPGDRIVLLRRLGDLSLFLTGVFPDHTGARPLRPVDAERLGRTIGMTADEILALCDGSLLFAGLDALESLGSRWYGAAVLGGSTPPVVGDVATRFRSARRVLNHLADRYLHRLETGWTLAA